MSPLLSASGRQNAFYELVDYLPGALALWVGSLVSGALGALIVIRLLYPTGPSIWGLVRIILSSGAGR